MTRESRSWQVLLGVQGASSQAAWQGIRLMLAYKALAETGSLAFVGVVAGLIAVSGLIVSIPTGRLIDRFGGARIALAGLGVSLAGVIAILLWHDVVGVVICALLVGVGFIFTAVAQQSTVTDLSTGSSPDAAFGALTSAVSVGQLIGPPAATMVAMAVSIDGAQPNTWAGAAACGVLFLLAAPPFFALRHAERGRVRQVRSPELPTVSLRTVLGSPAIVRAMLVGAAVIVSVDLLTSFFPVWAVENDISADVVGWLLALRALFTISSRFGAARLVARFGRKLLLIVALSFAVVGLALLPFAGVWAALPIMAACGIGFGLPQPLTLVWMSSLAPAHARGMVFGARMLVNRIAQVTFPVLVAMLAGPVGVMAVFWATAGILASGVLLIGVTPAAEIDDPRPPGSDDAQSAA